MCDRKTSPFFVDSAMPELYIGQQQQLSYWVYFNFHAQWRLRKSFLQLWSFLNDICSLCAARHDGFSFASSSSSSSSSSRVREYYFWIEIQTIYLPSLAKRYAPHVVCTAQVVKLILNWLGSHLILPALAYKLQRTGALWKCYIVIAVKRNILTRFLCM